jgi:uncharacterized phiE125 gp8 family phage protein
MSVLRLITASTDEPVSLAEAKLWLRLDEHDPVEDELVAGLVTRARTRWEAVTQRSALIQTYELVMDETPYESAVTLPKAPLVSVTSIKAYESSESDDSGGTAMSTSGYYVDTAQEFGRVMPLSAYSYPTSTREINGFMIRFTAGYSSGSSGVPDGVKTEIKQLVASLYEHRGDEAAQGKALSDYGMKLSEFDLPTWG